MFNVSPFAFASLRDLNADYTIHHGDGCVHVSIVDKATGIQYASASAKSGSSEADVLDAAVKKALGSERPKTPLELLRDRDQQIQQMQAELAELRAAKAGAKTGQTAPTETKAATTSEKPARASRGQKKDKEPEKTAEPATTTPSSTEDDDSGSGDDKFPEE